MPFLVLNESILIVNNTTCLSESSDGLPANAYATSYSIEVDRNRLTKKDRPTWGSICFTQTQANRTRLILLISSKIPTQSLHAVLEGVGVVFVFTHTPNRF
jgi:hypothetical protein